MKIMKSLWTWLTTIKYERPVTETFTPWEAVNTNNPPSTPRRRS